MNTFLLRYLLLNYKFLKIPYFLQRSYKQKLVQPIFTHKPTLYLHHPLQLTQKSLNIFKDRKPKNSSNKFFYPATQIHNPLTFKDPNSDIICALKYKIFLHTFKIFITRKSVFSTFFPLPYFDTELQIVI